MANKTKTLKIKVSLETWKIIDALDFSGIDTPESLLADAALTRHQAISEGCYTEHEKQYRKYLDFLNKKL